MTDLEYQNLSEQLLLAVEKSCDHINDTTDADIDAHRNAGVITLIFENGSQIVINQQKPLHEIWLAARAGGFHFRHDGQKWMDTKGAGEFFSCLSELASSQSGRMLRFSADI